MLVTFVGPRKVAPHVLPRSFNVTTGAGRRNTLPINKSTYLIYKGLSQSQSMNLN